MQSETTVGKAPINERQLNITTDFYISYLEIPPLEAVDTLRA